MDSLGCALFSVLVILTGGYSTPRPAFSEAEMAPHDLKANSPSAGLDGRSQLILFLLCLSSSCRLKASSCVFPPTALVSKDVGATGMHGQEDLRSSLSRYPSCYSSGTVAGDLQRTARHVLILEHHVVQLRQPGVQICPLPLTSCATLGK